MVLEHSQRLQDTSMTEATAARYRKAEVITNNTENLENCRSDSVTSC